MENYARALLENLFREHAAEIPGSLNKILGAGFSTVISGQLVTGRLEPWEAGDRGWDPLLKVETWEGTRLLSVEAVDRATRRKVGVWASRLASLENHHDLPTELLIIAESAGAEAWARDSLMLGRPDRPSLRLFPYLCGPGNMPTITDPAAVAEEPVYALILFLCHRQGASSEEILQALADSLDRFGDETAYLVAEWMRGAVLARARLIPMLLQHNGIELTEEQSARIASTDRLVLLQDWVMRAPYVASSDELFAD